MPRFVRDPDFATAFFCAAGVIFLYGFGLPAITSPYPDECS